MKAIRIQTGLFDAHEEEKKLRCSFPDDGAIVSFQGFVRGKDHNGSSLGKLYLEHYPAVTEKEIERIVVMAEKRWSLSGVIVIHRIGELKPGEAIILVLVSGQHRKEVFQAVEFIMDYLKTEAPFWKKEFSEDGKGQWVEVKQSDLEQKKRWEM